MPSTPLFTRTFIYTQQKLFGFGAREVGLWLNIYWHVKSLGFNPTITTPQKTPEKPEKKKKEQKGKEKRKEKAGACLQSWYPAERLR